MSCTREAAVGGERVVHAGVHHRVFVRQVEGVRVPEQDALHRNLREHPVGELAVALRLLRAADGVLGDAHVGADRSRCRQRTAGWRWCRCRCRTTSGPSARRSARLCRRRCTSTRRTTGHGCRQHCHVAIENQDGGSADPAGDLAVEAEQRAARVLELLRHLAGDVVVRGEADLWCRRDRPCRAARPCESAVARTPVGLELPASRCACAWAADGRPAVCADGHAARVRSRPGAAPKPSHRECPTAGAADLADAPWPRRRLSCARPEPYRRRRAPPSRGSGMPESAWSPPSCDPAVHRARSDAVRYLRHGCRNKALRPFSAPSRVSAPGFRLGRQRSPC